MDGMSQGRPEYNWTLQHALDGFFFLWKEYEIVQRYTHSYTHGNTKWTVAATNDQNTIGLENQWQNFLYTSRDSNIPKEDPFIHLSMYQDIESGLQQQRKKRISLDFKTYTRGIYIYEVNMRYFSSDIHL